MQRLSGKLRLEQRAVAVRSDEGRIVKVLFREKTLVQFAFDDDHTRLTFEKEISPMKRIDVYRIIFERTLVVPKYQLEEIPLEGRAMTETNGENGDTESL